MAFTITSLHRDAKDGEITGIIVDKKHVNGLETNSECVTFNHRLSVFSSPELKAHWWAYSIGRHRSSVIRHMSVNIFKYLLLRRHWVSWSQILCGGSMGRGNKGPSKGHGHMTKMAAMLIYGNNLKKSSLEPKGRWPWNLVCSIGYSGTTKFLQMMILGWPWPILQQGQIWSHMLLYGEKGKTMDFSETIVVYDLKLTTDDQSDKKFQLTSKLCPLGALCPLPRGYIQVSNHEKNCIKSDLKEISLKLATKGKVIRPFCWHKNFVPWGLSATAPGLYTWIKSWKKKFV